MSTSTTTFSTDPALYIFTSLTAGSSHIVTATSRLETILRANRVPFKAIDIATDEKARMLWGRRAGKDESGRVRKLPGLVQESFVLGDLVEIEDWNEYGELKQHVKIYYDDHTIPPISQAPKEAPKPTPAPAPAAVAAAPPPAPALPTETPKQSEQPKNDVAESASTVAAKAALPIRSIADEAAAKAKELHLQSLRKKVHGAAAAKKEDEKPTADSISGDSAAPEKAELPKAETGKEEEPSLGSKLSELNIASPSSPEAGLQSPTTGAWKHSADAAASLHDTLQSPTSTSWRPSDTNPPITSLHGSLVVSASEEEIAAIEKGQTIKEESEEEDEEDAPSAAGAGKS